MKKINLAGLNNPEQSLIIYGTLAPGRPNHFMVDQIKGIWQKGIVRGKLENKGWGLNSVIMVLSQLVLMSRKKLRCLCFILTN